jgi:hypothetical protein
MQRAILGGLGLILLLLGAGVASADIPVPDPPAVWSRGQEPESNTVVAVGAGISAVIVAAGLIFVRWPVRSTVGRIVVAAITGLALLAVWGIAGGTIVQAQRDRGLWKQWEIDESNRRSNWRGPPDFALPGPPPPTSAPAPGPSESAPPTAAPESVQ